MTQHSQSSAPPWTRSRSSCSTTTGNKSLQLSREPDPPLRRSAPPLSAAQVGGSSCSAAAAWLNGRRNVKKPYRVHRVHPIRCMHRVIGCVMPPLQGGASLHPSSFRVQRSQGCLAHPILKTP